MALDRDLAGIATRPPASVPGIVVGVGPPARLEALPAAFAMASRALQTAVAFGQEGVYSLADLSIRPAILADDALGDAFAARRSSIRKDGRALPGAREALAAVGRLRDVVQSVLTGSIERNAVAKLTALGLDKHLDFTVGGYGSETYPKAALVELARSRTGQKYGTPIAESATVLIADSPNDMRAAQISNARTIAVATGTATEAELRSAGADVVLPTLADTDRVVRAVESLTDAG